MKTKMIRINKCNDSLAFFTYPSVAIAALGRKVRNNARLTQPEFQAVLHKHRELCPTSRNLF